MFGGFLKNFLTFFEKGIDILVRVCYNIFRLNERGDFKMARDTKKEYKWSKTKYVRILGDIDKDLGTELKRKLKEEGKSVASWITENAKKYLKKN